jgi:uncharacterized NAD(P)/FAD-binding protein YdhS
MLDGDDTEPTRNDVAIVGGGFTGAMLAIRLASAATGALRVVIFEPRKKFGAGVAYSTLDPDHRLNGPIDLVKMLGEGHFQSWYRAHVHDPDDTAPDGFRYGRRATIGDYMNAVFSDACQRYRGTLRHVAREVTDIAPEESGYVLRDGAGRTYQATRVFLCIGHEPPTMSAPFDRLPASSRIVRDPWDTRALAAVPVTGDTLVIGSGLTAYDVIATLLRQGHEGKIVAVSRNGRRPQPQGELARLKPDFVPPLAPFAKRHPPPYTAMRLLQYCRQDLEELSQRGLEWHGALDNLRFALPDIWCGLPTAEKKRAIRHLASLYESHRFRVAPQTATIVERGEAAGAVRFVRGRAEDVTLDNRGYRATFRSARNGRFGVGFENLVNCTGPNTRVTKSANSLVRNLLDRGLARPHPTGMGFDVDDLGRSVTAAGRPLRNLTILGPLTNGHFADMIAMPQIDAKIRQILPELERETVALR